MNKFVTKGRAMQERLATLKNDFTADSFYTEGSAICMDVEDFILDFKTLVYNADPNAPIYGEVENLRLKEFMEFEDYPPLLDRAGYLLGKFVDYNNEE